MAKVRTFRDLIAWRKSMVLARKLYQATMKMADSERFVLTGQIRRCALSIPSNTAEVDRFLQGLIRSLEELHEKTASTESIR